MVDENIFCRKKGCGNPVCELHHYVPRSIGGTDKDGRVYLCKKHHDILHQILLKKVFAFVPDEKKAECQKAVAEFSRWWVDREW